MENEWRPITELRQIDHDISDYKELDFMIPSSNSLVRKNSCICFGNNNMVTCLDIQSGAVCYLTNKNEEEIKALSSMWNINKDS